MLDSIRSTSSRHGARFALVVVLALFSACVPVLGIDEPELATDTPCKKYLCANGTCGYQATNAGEPCGTKKVCDGAGECKGDTGAACANGSECISGGCDGTCKLKFGEPCEAPADCASGICFDSTCKAGIGTACSNHGECVSGICFESTCKLSDKSDCDDSASCLSGTCENKKCLVSDGEGCSVDSDCASGSCKGFACGFSNGKSCTNDMHCASGVCADKKCVAQSCIGLGSTCGSSGNEHCCDSPFVPKGSFDRSNDSMAPATVSDFRLDRFEVTVSRFRKFVDAYPDSKPAAGAGKHPEIDGSGWDNAWNSFLPTSKAELETSITNCADLTTWNANSGANNELPMNCVDWYLAFAFCAWDGGRLPTEAEWNYAAAGGNEQRVYPWSDPPSSTTIDLSYATYGCLRGGNSAVCDIGDIAYVGWTSPTGDNLWGQADMAGSMMEWVLDWYSTPYSQSCSNCANLATGMDRVLRGGSWFNNPQFVTTDFRTYSTPTLLDGLDIPADEIGIRCARSAQ